MRIQTTFPVLVLLLAASLGACGGGDEAVRVAVVLPESGAAAPYGEPVQRGVELAAEELARRHEAGELRYPIELAFADSESRPQRAAEALDELYETGARAAVGGVTNAEAAALIGVALDAERVLVSPVAGSDVLPDGKRYFFQLYPSEAGEGSKAARFAALELDLERAALLVAEDPYARAVADSFVAEFERNRGEIVERAAYGGEDAAIAAAVGRVLEARPQAVFVADSGPTASGVLSELGERGFRGKVLATSALAAPAALESAGRGAEGVIVSRPAFDPGAEDERVASFAAAYEERYGEAPSAYAAYGYDALMVIARAIEAEGPAAHSLWKGLRSLTEYPGATGFIQFDVGNRVASYPRVYVVRGGELELYRTESARRTARLEEEAEETG